LPNDVHIVSCHSLHGPSVSPLDQPLVIYNYLGLASLMLTLTV
jgi:prephenate dehydrogenase (NADP+)